MLSLTKQNKTNTTQHKVKTNKQKYEKTKHSFKTDVSNMTTRTITSRDLGLLKTIPI